MPAPILVSVANMSIVGRWALLVVARLPFQWILPGVPRRWPKYSNVAMRSSNSWQPMLPSALKPAKSKESAKSSQAAKDASTDEVEVGAEIVAEEKGWVLQEERRRALGLTEQAIRVAGCGN